MGARRRSLIAEFDPGWLFILAGSALLSAIVLVPAADDLARARWVCDAAEAQRDRQVERLANYSNYLDAVNRGEETVALELAATQLNVAPRDRRVFMLDTRMPGSGSASVFEALEPEPVHVRAFGLQETRLRRWATEGRTRLWLIAGGGMCVLIGLLPRAEVRAARPARASDAGVRADGAGGCAP